MKTAIIKQLLLTVLFRLLLCCSFILLVFVSILFLALACPEMDSHCSYLNEKNDSACYLDGVKKLNSKGNTIASCLTLFLGAMNEGNKIKKANMCIIYLPVNVKYVFKSPWGIFALSDDNLKQILVSLTKEFSVPSKLTCCYSWA